MQNNNKRQVCKSNSKKVNRREQQSIDVFIDRIEWSIQLCLSGQFTINMLRARIAVNFKCNNTLDGNDGDDDATLLFTESHRQCLHTFLRLFVSAGFIAVEFAFYYRLFIGMQIRQNNRAICSLFLYSLLLLLSLLLFQLLCFALLWVCVFVSFISCGKAVFSFCVKIEWNGIDFTWECVPSESDWAYSRRSPNGQK